MFHDPATGRYVPSDPFGMMASGKNPSGAGTFTYNPRFPGQVYDRETGLFYNYFRDYDPQTGRYIESDPIGLEGGINTYTYADENPLSLIDPYGLSGTTPKNYGNGKPMSPLPNPRKNAKEKQNKQEYPGHDPRENIGQNRRH